MSEKYIALSDLMKFPIRIDHYDKEHGDEKFVFGIETVLEYAEYLPVIEIVRCKDCGYYDVKNQVCTGRPTEPMMRREPDWYCAGGVRRDNDEC